MISLWLLWACQDAQMLDPLAEPDVSVEVQLEEKAVAAGDELLLELHLSTREGWSFDPFELDAAGLQAEELEALVEDIPTGERAVFRYGLSGEAGSYVLGPQAFSFTGPDGETVERESSRLFVDIGADGPVSELEGLFELPPAPENPWPKRIGLLALGAFIALLVGWWWMRRPRVVPPPPPPVPADEEALAAWNRVRERTDIDDHTRALLLSQIFRHYLERIFELPASAFTSVEVLRSVKEYLNEAHWGQSKRLLTATDRIKYARRGGGVALFDALDRDFREIVAATRSRAVREEEAARD